MKSIGNQVLSKIENLLTEINQKSETKTKKKIKKQQSTLNFPQQESQVTFNQKQTTFHQKPEKPEKPEKINKYNKMSYFYLSKNTENHKKRQDKVYEEQKQYQKFKVKNKKTLDILSKRSILPIYERVNDILQQKQKHINQVKLNKQIKEIQSMKPQKIKKPSQLQKKFNQQQFEQYVSQIQSKNKQRIHKIHLNQIKKMNGQSRNSPIPSINKISRSLSSKRNLSKQYSQNVYKRMQEYTIQRQMQKQQALKRQVQLEGGFRPAICPQSNKIIQKLGKISVVTKNTHILKCCQSGGTLASSHSFTKNKYNQKYKKSIGNNNQIFNKSMDLGLKKTSTSKEKSNVKDFNIKYSPLKTQPNRQKSLIKLTILTQKSENIQSTKYQKNQATNPKKEVRQNKTISPFKRSTNK